MKTIKSCYLVGTILSLLIGVWHFFVPRMFQWYAYIPNEYENLIVGIDWTNFLFSVLLTGFSLLLLLFQKKFFCGDKGIFGFYGLFVFVWFCRAVITFVVPWPLEPIAWVAYLQQIVSIMIFAVLLVPLVRLCCFVRH